MVARNKKLIYWLRYSMKFFLEKELYERIQLDGINKIEHKGAPF